MPRLAMTYDRQEMGRLGDWLDLQEHLLTIPAKITFKVRQCLEEAVINLIDHTPPLAGQDITVELDWQGNTLVVAVEDYGPPFDPRDAPTPVRQTSLESAVPGGWGIHLIRSFADGIAYQTVAGRNRLTLKFNAPSARPHRAGR